MTGRYAVYYQPSQETPLWRFGCSVIGYDALTGRDVGHLPVPGVPAEVLREATAAPRRYGFHATLKAPFELAPGCSEADLLAKAAEFAASRKAALAPPLELTDLDSFLALAPAEAGPVLDDLAGACVVAFEPYRGAISASDQARRLAKVLTERERQHLDTWGYPYVFEDFQFHLSLTGALEPGLSATLRPALEALYMPLQAPLPVDAIAIFHQPDRQSPFHVLGRFAFGA